MSEIIKLDKQIFIKGDFEKVINTEFRQLVKTGGYCETCMKEIANNKIKNSYSEIKNYNEQQISSLSDIDLSTMKRYWNP